jgi:hypothetical protein
MEAHSRTGPPDGGDAAARVLPQPLGGQRHVDRLAAAQADAQRIKQRRVPLNILTLILQGWGQGAGCAWRNEARVKGLKLARYGLLPGGQ